jgi:hypothetical protein
MSSKSFLTGLIASGVCAALAQAQPPAPPAAPEDTLFFLENVAPLPAFGARIDIIRGEGGIEGPIVKGKPYSARSITESTQMLADGNRITQRNEAVIHRDGEGRTRREQTLTGIGPWQAGEPVTMINIHDPVADKSYSLDPTARTARENRKFEIAIADAQGELAKARTEVRTVYRAGAAVPAPVPAPLPGAGGGVTVVHQDGDHVQVVRQRGIAVAPFPEGTTGMYEPAEELGEQVLEGLLVQGKRWKDTIPAGTIGNERAIDVVTDRWYSKDIDATVLERHSDPRFGETTYRLVNVVLGEPSPDLFQVPQGYEIVTDEMPRAGFRRMGPGTPGQPVEFQLRRLETDLQRVEQNAER